MNRNPAAGFSWLLFCGLALTACQGGSDNVSGAETTRAVTTVHSKPESADRTTASAAKPRISPDKAAPINIDYEIIGTPVIGIPLSINVKVSSGLDKPIRVNYRINDTTSLMFPDAQSKTVSLVPIGDEAYSAEQVTVIPQREGRLFLNISAEVDTDVGTMARVMAIPIQVGSLRRTPQVNGGLTTGEDGEALISMPAKED